MQDVFKSLDGEEKAKLFNSFLAEAKDKRAHKDDDHDEVCEGFKMLAGDIANVEGCSSGVFDQIVYPAWKAFSPSHGGAKQPDPIFRATMPFREPLSHALQALSRYSMEKFDYVRLSMLCGLDAFFEKCAVGYARHRWDDALGIARSDRFDPKSVYWQAGASSVEKATHVIERHVLPRYQFAKKFGKRKAQEADAHKDGTSWPKQLTEKEKSPLDKIEYFLLWSKEGGYKRVYAFTKKPEDGLLNGDDGEAWPIELADDDWHLTPLEFTPIPGKLEGASPYWSNRDQLIAYQRLNRAVFYASLKCGKVIGMVPDELKEVAELIERADRAVTIATYDRTNLQAPLKELIEKWEMPKVPDTLLQAREEALMKWQKGIGVNAVTMLDPQGMETATEAQSLQSAAANMIADDQGAVERFQTEVFRKEMFINLSRMPKRSVICIKPFETKEEEPEGEFADDVEEKAYDSENPEDYLEDVPYEEAVLLEKGVRSMAATKRIAKAREKKGSELAFNAAMQGAQGPQLDEARAQGEQMIPATPEMQVREKWGVPMDAVCKIVNPGVEQFIGPEAAEGWVEGMTPRQIQAEIGVTVERGSSSAMGRMQNMNESMMAFNTLAEHCLTLGQYDLFCALGNAILGKTENPLFDNVKLDPAKVQAAIQQQQQAAQQQAEAEAAAKQGGQQPENPETVRMQTDAEHHKAAASEKASEAKIITADLKRQSDEARDRTRSQSQLMQGGVPGV